MIECTVCPLPRPIGHLTWLLAHRDAAHPEMVARVVPEVEWEPVCVTPAADYRSQISIRASGWARQTA